MNILIIYYLFIRWLEIAVIAAFFGGFLINVIWNNDRREDIIRKWTCAEINNREACESEAKQSLKIYI